MNKIAASESEYAAEAAELAAEEAQISKELAAAEKAYAAQIAALTAQNNATTGSWTWPLPGIYKLSSLFGGRADPFTGAQDNHTGTDIPASTGTKILAAKGGIVTTVATNKYSSYGYYVMIDHGNGYVTLYAHMNSQAIVKVGDTVTAGQVIGYVGSTGRSTGPHLHFELRRNGVRADVLNLYPGMSFTSPSGGTIKIS
jgi:murein DD-endopeptidase MepM/ murein hydrolase activator NlpD